MVELTIEEISEKVGVKLRPLIMEDIKTAMKEFLTAQNSTASVTVSEPKEEHLMREWEQFCPDCGIKNPQYVAPKFKCKNCKAPVGQDLAKVDRCPYCGSQVAEKIDA